MALLIKKPITILGEIEINEFYVRLNYKVSVDGKSVESRAFCYLSKESYELGKEIEISQFPRFFMFDYIRTDNNIDVLQFLHNSIINYLSNDHTDEDNEKVIHKFCEVDEITIIDI